jgi:hypothetical protein
MKRAQPWLAAWATVLALAGCAEHAVIQPAERAGTLGTLDAAYDRSQWRWVKNPDGRELLEHTQIRKCFVDPKPDSGYNEPGFTMKRDQKTFGAARYNVIYVYEGKDFWIAVYQRDGAQAPALGVFADGRCRDAAENILRAYETKKGPA